MGKIIQELNKQAALQDVFLTSDQAETLRLCQDMIRVVLLEEIQVSVVWVRWKSRRLISSTCSAAPLVHGTSKALITISAYIELFSGYFQEVGRK